MAFDLDDEELESTKRMNGTTKNRMCKYCDLLSGGFSILDEHKENELRIERHNNTYEITTFSDCCDYNVEINHCPMCGKKLGGKK